MTYPQQPPPPYGYLTPEQIAEAQRRRKSTQRITFIAVGVLAAVMVIGIGVVAALGSRDNVDNIPAPAEPADKNIAAQIACEFALEDRAYNPDSVTYRDENVIAPPAMSGVWIVTGEVNAENRLGGMTGFQPMRCQVRWNATAKRMVVETASP